MTSDPHFLQVTIKGQGDPLLCLHGHPGSKECMAVFTDRLCHRWYTLAPDLRGYGKSSTRHPFTVTDHLRDLEAMLDRQNIDRCWVLGWSLGGILALELALAFPDRIQGLILIATAARPRGSHPPVSWQDEMFTGIASVLNKLHPGWRWNIDHLGKRSLYRYLIQQHTPIAYRYLADAAFSAYLNTSKSAHQALRQALRQGYNRLPDLYRIQCPVLLLAAEGDRHITAASSQETAEHLPHCQWKQYAQTAHLFPWEIPDQVLDDIEQWLDAQGITGASTALPHEPHSMGES